MTNIEALIQGRIKLVLTLIGTLIGSYGLFLWNRTSPSELTILWYLLFTVCCYWNINQMENDCEEKSEILRKELLDEKPK